MGCNTEFCSEMTPVLCVSYFSCTLSIAEFYNKLAMAHLAAWLAAALLATPTTAGMVYPDCANGLLKSNLVCNTSAPAAARAAALVAVMSSSEMLENLVKSVPPY